MKTLSLICIIACLLSLTTTIYSFREATLLQAEYQDAARADAANKSLTHQQRKANRSLRRAAIIRRQNLSMCYLMFSVLFAILAAVFNYTF